MMRILSCLSNWKVNFLGMALILGACSTPNRLSVLSWNATVSGQISAVKDIKEASVQILAFSSPGHPDFYGTGVILANTSFNGYPAIITAGHIAEPAGRPYAGTFKIFDKDGSFLGFATPIFTGYPKHPLFDDIVAFKVDPASVPLSNSWNKVVGVSFSSTLFSGDFYSYVSQPFGMGPGDSGSGWFDSQGRLLGISSRIIQNAQTALVPAVVQSPIDNETHSATTIKAPQSDIVIIDTLNTPYLEGLFPDLYRNVLFSKSMQISDGYSFGYGYSIVYRSSHIDFENSCLVKVDELYGENDSSVSTVSDLMNSSECDPVRTILANN